MWGALLICTFDTIVHVHWLFLLKIQIRITACTSSCTTGPQISPSCTQLIICSESIGLFHNSAEACFVACPCIHRCHQLKHTQLHLVNCEPECLSLILHYPLNTFCGDAYWTPASRWSPSSYGIQETLLATFSDLVLNTTPSFWLQMMILRGLQVLSVTI